MNVNKIQSFSFLDMGNQCKNVTDLNKNLRLQIKKSQGEVAVLSSMALDSSALTYPYSTQISEYMRQIPKQKQIIKTQAASERNEGTENWLVKYKEGMVYQGEMWEGYRQGQGSIQWPDGTKYEGCWKKNLAHGHGSFITQSFKYDGDWRQNQPDGQGTLTCPKGTYKGGWQKSHPHGIGQQLWQNGNIYEGLFEQGSKWGNGKFLWADGATYEGQWVMGRIQGNGTFKSKDGRVYTGQWMCNRMHGFGCYKWADGRKYVGDYVEDKKSGFGKYYWPDGRLFEGKWLNGKKNGEGKMIYPSGNVYKGEWKDDIKLQINKGKSDYYQTPRSVILSFRSSSVEGKNRMNDRGQKTYLKIYENSILKDNS